MTSLLFGRIPSDVKPRRMGVREVVDSLIAAEAIEPIVIVMPYCFTRTCED